MALSISVVREQLAGQYDVERLLGVGGMATVFLARAVGSDVPLAIKVLRPELAAAIGAQRFHREVKILAGLHHPNVLPLLDSGEAESLLYFVMPCAQGGSLRTLLRRGRCLSVEQTISIARGVAAGLDCIHSHNIVHRDIKPENIVFEDDRAMLCDFGAARAIVVAAGDRISSTGLVVGTPEYMSPEQAAGESDLASPSDIYSLACVLFEMLTGDPPFTGKPQAVMAKHVKEQPPSLRVVRPDVPAHLDQGLLRALAKNPSQRPRAAAALLESLSAA